MFQTSRMEVVPLPPSFEATPRDVPLWIRLPMLEGGKVEKGNLRIRIWEFTLTIESPQGTVSIEDPDLNAWATELHLWLNQSAESLILCSKTSEKIYRLDLAAPHVEVFSELERGPEGNLNHDYRFLTTTTSHDSALVMLFERGILAIGRDITLLWLTRIELTDAWFLEEEDDVLWFECIFPGDWRGYVRGVRLSNGELIEERLKS